MAGSPRLFEHDLPVGFHYRDNVITNAEERALLDTIADIAFADFEMRGVVARRRVAFFGRSYDRAPTAPFPAFLLPLRAALAEWAGVDADAFAMALINEYRPGSPIGWHRDAPQYDIVAGVSLLSACRMKFRPYRPPASTAAHSRRRSATHEIALFPRSAYLMTQESRHGFEHHIPPVGALRFGDVPNSPITSGAQSRRRPSNHVLTPSEMQQWRRAANGQMVGSSHGIAPDVSSSTLERPWAMVNLETVWTVSTVVVV
jgi:hypothetical protein